jgi:class 3 adenylate cyclase/tetratricopeptide (TPR) repeat protein
LRESGRRTTVTLLFGDLVGSTELGSRLDPEVLRGVLSSYWDVARAAVERHGGTVEKFIGDAVVAVFGIPVVREDDAIRSVRAAVDLLAAVDDLNAGLRERLDVELAVRVGLNTGEVMIADATGDVALMAGDAANVGARLEQAAGPGEVLIGASTYALAKDHIDVDELPALTAKGKAEPLIAYRLRRVHPSSEPMRRRRFSGPLVGRRRALLQARMAYDTAVEERACALLTVVGSPGVGKSRLVEELLAQVRGEAHVLAGRCLSYGDGITYWPVAEMIQPIVDGARGWPASLSGVEHAEEIASGLDTMLGRSTLAGSAQMAWAFRRLLESLARDRPVVVVVDDVQWAEPPLLDLLDHVTDLSRDAPILIVCMARPEFLQTRSGWGAGRRHVTTTVLAPLTENDSAALAEGLLGRGLDPQLLHRITAAAEGIPLYVEELVASFADQGRLKLDEAGHWRAIGDLGDIAVPPTVQALLAARLDRLPPEQRDVVDAAAVIGQTFYPDAVTLWTGGDADGTSDAISALVRADLVRPVDSDVPGHDAYAFAHLLVRDAAYDAMPKARRADAHLAFAGWLEATNASRVSPELVASHLERCCAYRAELGDPDLELADRTARRLVTCAERARALSDVSGAQGLLVAAAALVPFDSATGVAVTLARAEVSSAAGDFALAADLADRAARVASERGLESAAWRARLLAPWIAQLTDPDHDIEAAVAFTDLAIDALSTLGDDAALAQAYELLCYQQSSRGRLLDLGVWGREGLAAAARTRNLDLVARLMARRMHVFLLSCGTLPEEQQAVAELVAEFGDEPSLAPDLERYRMLLRCHQGQLGEFVDYARTRAALVLEQGNVVGAFILHDQASNSLYDAGELMAAAESFAYAVGLLEGVGETAYRSTQLADLGIAFARLGRESEAWSALDESRRLSQSGDAVNPILYAMAEGLLLARRGEGTRSEERFEQGLLLLRATDFAMCTRDLWLARSEAREVLGDPEDALRCAREALEVAAHQGFVPALRAVRERVASCEALLGEQR